MLTIFLEIRYNFELCIGRYRVGILFVVLVMDEILSACLADTTLQRHDNLISSYLCLTTSQRPSATLLSMAKAGKYGRRPLFVVAQMGGGGQWATAEHGHTQVCSLSN